MANASDNDLLKAQEASESVYSEDEYQAARPRATKSVSTKDVEQDNVASPQDLKPKAKRSRKKTTTKAMDDSETVATVADDIVEPSASSDESFSDETSEYDKLSDEDKEEQKQLDEVIYEARLEEQREQEAMQNASAMHSQPAQQAAQVVEPVATPAHAAYFNDLATEPRFNQGRPVSKPSNNGNGAYQTNSNVHSDSRWNNAVPVRNYANQHQAAFDPRYQTTPTQTTQSNYKSNDYYYIGDTDPERLQLWSSNPNQLSPQQQAYINVLKQRPDYELSESGHKSLRDLVNASAVFQPAGFRGSEYPCVYIPKQGYTQYMEEQLPTLIASVQAANSAYTQLSQQPSYNMQRSAPQMQAHAMQESMQESMPQQPMQNRQYYQSMPNLQRQRPSTQAMQTNHYAPNQQSPAMPRQSMQPMQSYSHPQPQAMQQQPLQPNANYAKQQSFSNQRPISREDARYNASQGRQANYQNVAPIPRGERNFTGGSTHGYAPKQQMGTNNYVLRQGSMQSQGQAMDYTQQPQQQYRQPQNSQMMQSQQQYQQPQQHYYQQQAMQQSRSPLAKAEQSLQHMQNAINHPSMAANAGVQHIQATARTLHASKAGVGLHELQEIKQIKHQHGAVPALSKLLEVIEHCSGIKATEVSSDPFEYYVMRKQERVEVAKQVEFNQRQYYFNYLKEMRVRGNINPDISFDNSKVFKHDTKNEEAVKIAINFAAKQAQMLSNRLFLVIGNLGAGKTYMCHGVANAFLYEKERQFAQQLEQLRLGTKPQEQVTTAKQGATSWQELFNSSVYGRVRNPHLPLVMLTTLDEIRQTRIYASKETQEEREAREERFKMFCEVDLLLIDNVLQDKWGLEQFVSRIFYELLNYRATHNLPVMMTTGIAKSSLHQSLGDSCFEALRSFQVDISELLGASRRPPIMYHNQEIV